MNYIITNYKYITNNSILKVIYSIIVIYSIYVRELLKSLFRRIYDQFSNGKKYLHLWLLCDKFKQFNIVKYISISPSFTLKQWIVAGNKSLDTSFYLLTNLHTIYACNE